MKKFLQKGQVTVLALLLGLMGLTIGLSVLSRSLSDLKQVSYVDSGTKAYAAAEAGLQYAFTLPTETSTNSCTLITEISGITLAGVDSVSYQKCSNTRDFAEFPAVEKDGVAQVDVSGLNAQNVRDFMILWKNPATSVEISYLDNANRIYRSGFKVSGPGNNFVAAMVGNNYCMDTPANNNVPACNSDGSYQYCAGYFSGNSAVGVLSLIENNKTYSNGDKLIRAKVYGDATDIKFCALGSGNSPGRLSSQYVTITAIATAGGSVKRLQATKNLSTMPGIFDNVIFANGDITK